MNTLYTYTQRVYLYTYSIYTHMCVYMDGVTQVRITARLECSNSQEATHSLAKLSVEPSMEKSWFETDGNSMSVLPKHMVPK